MHPRDFKIEHRQKVDGSLCGAIECPLRLSDSCVVEAEITSTIENSTPIERTSNKCVIVQPYILAGNRPVTYRCHRVSISPESYRDELLVHKG